MKKSLLAAVLVMAEVGFATPVVSGVTAKQRYPWNGLVDITVTLSGTEEECTAAMFPFYVTNKTTRAALPIGSVKAVGAIAGSGNTWTRRFIWHATADVGCAKFGEVELTVGAPVTGGVQLWENGPYWAECNVGASQPEECGYYFWWGDTVGYKRNANDAGWISVKTGASYSFDDYGCPTSFMDNQQLQLAGYIDSAGNLAAKHDAATAHCGVPWRMPTDAEFSALIGNCTLSWTMRNGVYGRLITGKGGYASKSIFLPAAGSGHYSNIGSRESGDYWSSTPDSGHANRAWYLDFSSSTFSRVVYYGRGLGLLVRPVRGFAQ